MLSKKSYLEFNKQAYRIVVNSRAHREIGLKTVQRNRIKKLLIYTLFPMKVK